jgi:predicted dehydrogenase
MAAQERTMQPVVWGVLSVSRHFAYRVRPALKGSVTTEVAAIASRSRQKAERAALDLSIPKAYGSYEELLADPTIEAVYIPLPNHLHAEWVKKASDAGKHVLCEKPFGMNADETRQSIAHAQARGVLVMEAFMYRFHPQWRRVRELVAIGEIGAVRAVHTFFSYLNTDPANIRNILEAGGGGIPDIGCYAVSSARFVLGREPERAISLVARDPAFKTDVLSSAILDFGDARALFTVATQTHPVQHVEVIGTGGTILVPLPFNAHADVPQEVTVTTRIGARTIRFPVVDQYAIMFDEVSRAIRAGGPVPTDPADAVNNMKVLDALFRSETSKAWERV